MAVRQAYRFALDPTPLQERALRSPAGTARFAWNWGLSLCTQRYEAEARWYSAADLLARAISDQGFGAARRMLGYKTEWNGGTLRTADHWLPSSKVCSACGTVKAKLPLSERTFRCDARQQGTAA